MSKYCISDRVMHECWWLVKAQLCRQSHTLLPDVWTYISLAVPILPDVWLDLDVWTFYTADL